MYVPISSPPFKAYNLNELNYSSVPSRSRPTTLLIGLSRIYCLTVLLSRLDTFRRIFQTNPFGSGKVATTHPIGQ